MNDNLDTQSRDNLINYRIERAFETLKEADFNASGNFLTQL